jgi:META domain/Type III secretion system lipoprotein chaperone (YscW)
MTHHTCGPVAAVFLSIGLLTGGCMSNAARSDASLTGTATYRERIALPPDAVFEATLEDVSRADTPAEVVSMATLNRMMGSYTLDGSKLTLSQMAGTMMACPQGMDLERAFYAALPRVATWRIDGEKLELFDAGGTSVAEFESRYMK